MVAQKDLWSHSLMTSEVKGISPDSQVRHLREVE